MFSYPFHIRDYLTKTRHLSPIEDLAYRRLLDAYYTEERPLPESPEQCARLIALREHTQEVKVVLEEFFELRDGAWHNERCDHELAKYHSKAERANKANAKRWESKSDLKSDVKSDVKSETDHIPTSKPENQKTRKPKKTVDMSGFDQFWLAYPRKTAKSNAQESWARLSPDDDTTATIMASLAKHKTSRDWTKDGGQFIPHPATWINQRRWEDELSSADTGGFDWDNELRGAV